MNLAMMRDIDRADPIGGLGPRVTPAPTPAPAPVRRPDGIVVGSDGKMSTDLPLPPGMEPSPWPFPTGTAAPAPEPEPGAHGFMRVLVLDGYPPARHFSAGDVILYRHSEENAGLVPIEGQPAYLIQRFPYDEEGNWWRIA